MRGGLINQARGRHPIRAALIAPPRRAASDDSDLKLFVLSFTAFFVCIYTFVM